MVINRIITFVSMTGDVYDIYSSFIAFPSLLLRKYDNLGTRVINIICHGHSYNILYI